MAIQHTQAEIAEALGNLVTTARRYPDPGPHRRADPGDPYARIHDRINELLYDWELAPAALENA